MSRQTALQKELEQVTSLNKTVDALLETIEKTGNDIGTIKNATYSSGGLLEDWIKILNQANFAQNALADPQWKDPVDEDAPQDSDIAQAQKLQAELDALNKQNDSLRQRIQAPAEKRRRM